MSYIQPKTDFKDGDVLYGIDLNASNEVIKAGVDDNFDRIQGLEAGKQDTLTAGTGIEITEDNVINNTQTSAEWGNIQGDITDQTDLQSALGDKVDKVEGKGLSTNDYDNTAKGIVDNVTTNLADKVDKVEGKGLSTEDYTTAEKTKLSGIDSGAEANIIETVKVDNTALTPDANKAVNINLSGKIDEPSSEGTNGQVLTTDGNGGRTWTTVQGGGGTGDYDDLENRPQINNVTLTGNLSTSDLGISIPTKTSDLNNDSNFVQDANYEHITVDSFFSNTSTNPVQNRIVDAAINSKADISSLSTVATSGSYADLSNKPTIPTKLSDLTNDNNTVTDASYVHTDNNYTTAEKTKLSGIEAGAQVNVDEVVVSDETAITNDTKIYIEEEDLDGQYLPVDEDIYSTTETKTNKVWIDGKPIYRKVINTVSPNQTTTAAQIGTIGSINTLISIDANIDLGGDGLVPLPQTIATDNIHYLYLQNKTNGNVMLKIGNNVYKNKPLIVILEYTKTS